MNNDLISRHDAIDYCYQLINVEHQQGSDEMNYGQERVNQTETILHHLELMPSAQPEKENPRRVLWSGWKGTRDTRYKCPNCNKPVKNDDVYCHRCGQKLMFPHISHTPYIEGQKQELIVRWDDEG